MKLNYRFLWVLFIGLNIMAGHLAVGATPETAPSIEFVENRGQWPAQVRFAADLSAGKLYAEKQGFTYSLLASSLPQERAPAPAANARHAVPRYGHAYRIHFDGSSSAALLQGLHPTGQRYNYMLGNDSSRWASAVPGFRAVQYQQLYPYTSLQLYENSRHQLEYTFTVSPGGRPAIIALRYEGAEAIQLDREGNLRIETSIGRVTELAPQAWQLSSSGQRQPVACAFALEKNTVHFRLGAYDPTRPLIIDPVVLFATFTGSRADNWGHTATYDAQGNLYSAGTVFSAGYPTSSGAFDASFNGSFDLAIIKYNTTVAGPGSRVYATYLGGSDADIAHRLVVDSQGELIMLGTTGSPNFPVRWSAARRFQGGPAIMPEYGYEYRHGADLFVARLSADGGRLVGSTYLGGSNTDGLPLPGYNGRNPNLLPQIGYAAWRGDVQVDTDGSVYIASSTASADFPSLNSFQTTYRHGATDAVVCCLSPSLRLLRWSAFLGGRAADAAFSLSLAPNGLLYVGGASLSPDLPVTATAYQPAAQGGADGFIAALSRDGQTLHHLCRIGTEATDIVDFVQADASSTIYLAGRTQGRFPGTAANPGWGGIFMQQLSPDLSRSLFIKTLGAGQLAATLDLTAFRADDCGRLYLAAVGPTADLPLTEGIRPYEATYVARFSAQARTLEFGACYGGDHTHGISRFSPEGVLYQSVCAACRVRPSSFFVPSSANYYALGSGASNCNDASLKIAVAPADPARISTHWCVDGGPMLLGGSPAGGVWSGPGVRLSPDGAYVFVPDSSRLGLNVLTYTAPAGSNCAGSQLALQIVRPQTATIAPIGGPYCASQLGSDIGLQAQPAGGEFSGPGVRFGRFSPAEAGPGIHTIRYAFSRGGVCSSGTLTVTVLGTALRIGPDTVLCGPPYRPFQLRASPAGGTWSGYGVSPTGWFDPALLVRDGIVSATTANPVYTYTSPDSCVTRSTAFILLAPPPPALPSLASAPCALQPAITGYVPYTIKLPELPSDFNATYYWDYGDGESSYIYQGSLSATAHTYTKAGSFTPTLHIEYSRLQQPVCPRTVALAPIVLGEPSVLPNIITPNGDGLNDFFVQRQFCDPPALRIYSRWGQEVYRSEQYRNDWNAPGLPAGTYYYRFTGEQGRSAKGWLEVQR